MTSPIMTTTLCILLSALLMILSTHPASAFLNGNLPLPDVFQKAFLPKHDLPDIQESFLHTILDMHLDIAAVPIVSSSSEKTKSSHLLTQRAHAEPRIAIRNLIVELQDARTNTPATTTTQPKLPALHMPGRNGPHPMSSSGVAPLLIHQAGHFITVDMGQTFLPLDTAQWELIWKEQSPAGVLVCGLALREAVQRNQALLPKGTLYISFPVWDADKLQEYQKKKLDCEVASKMHMQERDDELRKMTQTNNVLAKMIHYRNAFAAVEQYSLQPRKLLSHVPSSVEEVLSIAGGTILLSRKGEVRIVPDKLRHHPNDAGVARGTALIRPPAAASSLKP